MNPPLPLGQLIFHRHIYQIVPSALRCFQKICIHYLQLLQNRCWLQNSDLHHEFGHGIIFSSSFKQQLSMWTGWFQSTLGFDLLGFRSILVSICKRYQFQTAHYSIYTNSDLHIFRSAQFLLRNFWICKDFALLSIRSARISICKSILDL